MLSPKETRGATKVLIRDRKGRLQAFDVDFTEDGQHLCFQAHDGDKTIDIPIRKFSLQTSEMETESQEISPDSLLKATVTMGNLETMSIYFKQFRELQTFMRKVHFKQGFLCRSEQYQKSPFQPTSYYKRSN